MSPTLSAEELESLKFPFGPFELPKSHKPAEREDWINVVSNFPAKLRALTDSLSDAQLDLCYRPEGWNIRQLVHHCADSHMNAFVRFKLALTESTPTIRPYEEANWADQVDHHGVPISHSLDIISGVHYRWTVLLQSMSDNDFDRRYIHPEHGLEFSLWQALANYDWHCRHHMRHVELALAGTN